MTGLSDLQNASWNSVPFYVEGAEPHVGRNTGDHVYPLRERNPIWVEDVGLAPSVHRIVGFLIGDDVQSQQNTMIEAMQRPGQGQLIHPMRGSLTGSIVGGCRFLLRKDRGRYIEISFTFVENEANAPFPETKSDTGAVVKDAAAVARTSTLGDLGSALGSGLTQAQQAVRTSGLGDLGSALGSGFKQVQQAVREVQAVGQQALSIGRSAMSVIGITSALPGNFGRFVGGGGAIGSAFQGISTVEAAISTASSLGARVTSTVANVQRLAARL